MDSVARARRRLDQDALSAVPQQGGAVRGNGDRAHRSASSRSVKLRACDGGDVEAALAEALLMCGELMLDGEVIALQRVIAGESDKFPDIAEAFFTKAITPNARRAGRLAARASEARHDRARRCRCRRRHAARHARAAAATRGHVRASAATKPQRNRATREGLRRAVPQGMPPSAVNRRGRPRDRWCRHTA